MKRRNFIRTAAAAGIVGMAANSVVSAGDGGTWQAIPQNYEDPEHDDEFWVRDPVTKDIATVDDYAASGDSFVWVHGYNVDFDSATADIAAKRDRVDTYWSTDVDLYGFTWNGQDDFAFDSLSALDFETAENHAWQSSTNLAKFLHVLDDGIAAAGGGKIHLGAHSLGARVVLEALNNLVDDWYAAAIETVSIVGGAVDDDQIHDKFEPGIDHVDGQAWNYYNHDDQALEWYHWTHNTGGASAIGEVGAWSSSDHRLPEKYNDVDVTYQTPGSGTTESHVNYLDPDKGAPNLVFPPSSTSGGGGGGGGGGTPCTTQTGPTVEEPLTGNYTVDPC